MSNQISPELDVLIDEIDQQIESCPHPYGAEDGNPLYAGALEQAKRRGRQYIRFYLSGMALALPLANALQIGYTPDVTTLPNLPRWVLGVCNIRGEIISLVDLKYFLNLEHRVSSAPANLIILHHQNITTGIMVDKIAGILFDDDPDNEIQERDVKEERLSEYVQSVLVSDGQIFHLLDVKRLLSSIQIPGRSKTCIENAS